MLSRSLDHGVLVVTVHEDPGTGLRVEFSARIRDLVRAHEPTPVVVVIDEAAATPGVVRALVDAYGDCGDLGVLASVATHSASARRLFEVAADRGGPRLVVHSRIDVAVTTAYTVTA
ncbi:hypothetical protein ACFVU0_21580 [Streptomyces sp. NPDC058122]|uniref:hypothetical protein n=1 Tax=unclassified Streptomyces TaxID=2593676 RepID=UPI003654CF3E